MLSADNKMERTWIIVETVGERRQIQHHGNQQVLPLPRISRTLIWTLTLLKQTLQLLFLSIITYFLPSSLLMLWLLPTLLLFLQRQARMMLFLTQVLLITLALIRVIFMMTHILYSNNIFQSISVIPLPSMPLQLVLFSTWWTHLLEMLFLLKLPMVFMFPIWATLCSSFPNLQKMVGTLSPSRENKPLLSIQSLTQSLALLISQRMAFTIYKLVFVY